MNEIAKDLIKYLILSHIPGIGPVNRNRVLKLTGNIDNCFEASLDDLTMADKQMNKRHRIGAKRLETFACFRNDPQVKDKCDQVLEKCEEEGINIITPGSADYPDRFAGIDDMPLVLYAKGSLNINEYEKSVGIVGARRCTRGGKERTVEIAHEELLCGNAIISGMAKGIDSYAHTAAIKDGGYTIAVLGNGPDICYPPEHKALYDEICKKGCVLSEYPPGIKPSKYMFPQRNRLIAALSDKLYIVDAGRNSGANITAEDGRIYGREVIEE